MVLPERRRPGRPRRPPSERKIEPSMTGRLTWEAGDPHPLDVLFTEAAATRAHLPQTYALFQDAMTRFTALLDPLLQFTEADQQAEYDVWHHLRQRKHYDHLQAAMSTLRRVHHLGRLQAIHAALELINDLLTMEVEPVMSQPVADPAPPTTHVSQHKGSEWRRRLRTFDAQLDAIRRPLVRSRGWFEKRYTRRGGKDGETRIYGPYLAYRWREEGRVYTVYLGHCDQLFSEAPAAYTPDHWQPPGD